MVGALITAFGFVLSFGIQLAGMKVDLKSIKDGITTINKDVLRMDLKIDSDSNRITRLEAITDQNGKRG
jgi:hypothetical protein